MTHQTYLDWYFSSLDSPAAALTAGQQAELDGHLQACLECRQAVQAWQALELELRQPPQLAPQPGFSQRWLEYQAADSRARQRRQGLLLFGLSMGFMLALLGLLLYLSWPLVRSPEMVFLTLVYQVARWLSLASAAQVFISQAIQASGLSSSPLTWLFITGLASLLAVSWLVSYRLLTIPRRVSK